MGLGINESVSARSPRTGEPDAGKPPVRSGGRGAGTKKNAGLPTPMAFVVGLARFRPKYTDLLAPCLRSRVNSILDYGHPAVHYMMHDQAFEPNETRRI